MRPPHFSIRSIITKELMLQSKAADINLRCLLICGGLAPPTVPPCVCCSNTHFFACTRLMRRVQTLSLMTCVHEACFVKLVRPNCDRMLLICGTAVTTDTFHFSSPHLWCDLVSSVIHYSKTSSPVSLSCRVKGVKGVIGGWGHPWLEYWRKKERKDPTITTPLLLFLLFLSLCILCICTNMAALKDS